MIPLRLVFGEASPHVVHVDALDITIAVERTVAAFPVPLDAYRVAIDTNIPQVVVSIRGIIQDDPIGGTPSTKPSSILWDIRYYPTTVPAASSAYASVESLLQTARLHLKPVYWNFRSPICTSSGNQLVLVFNSNVSNRAGGVASPSVDPAYALAENSNQVRINVPIGGVLFNPDNGNPASTLALIIQDALQLTTEITKIGSCDGLGGKRVADAFSVTVNGSVIQIQDVFVNSSTSHTPMFRISSPTFYRWPLNGIVLNSSQVGSSKGMSAGDKAQNLLGLLSNSTKDKDLLRGIQIPYNSLITSNEISPTVRNFFLTSGKVTPLDKGSLGNQRPSTRPMEIAPVTDDGPVFATFESVADFVFPFDIGGTDVLGDAWAKLGGAGTTNTGGISVIPESLHLTKEGADNYYQFDLQVISADHVIGVN